MFFDNRVVFDLISNKVEVRPDNISDRAWRNRLWCRNHINIPTPIHPYAFLAIELKWLVTSDPPVPLQLFELEKRTEECRKLREFGTIVEKIVLNMAQSYHPGIRTRFNDDLFLRCTFLTQLASEKAMYDAVSEGRVFSRAALDYVVYWIQQIIAHGRLHGKEHVPPNFNAFVAENLNWMTFKLILEKIEWMRNEYDRIHVVFEQFLASQDLTLEMLWGMQNI